MEKSVKQFHNLQQHYESYAMYLELRHLRAVRAIHEAGGLARAADVMNLTQSALSHQIKNLEAQAGVDLFLRRTKPLRLSPAGEKVLRLAERILPEIVALEEELSGVEEGRVGRLHIAIECHACFDWLLPILELFRRSWPDVDVDIRPGLSFDALPALMREEVDLVVSSDPEDLEAVTFSPLFDYAPVFVCATQNPLAERPYIVAEDLRDQNLITYPVDRQRLDAFTELLDPAGVEPLSVRQVELTAMILMLVASNRGVAILPDWVARTVKGRGDHVVLPLTSRGLTKRLYAATRTEDLSRPYMAHVLRLGRTEPVKLLR